MNKEEAVKRFGAFVKAISPFLTWADSEMLELVLDICESYVRVLKRSREEYPNG